MLRRIQPANAFQHQQESGRIAHGPSDDEVSDGSFSSEDESGYRPRDTCAATAYTDEIEESEFSDTERPVVHHDKKLDITVDTFNIFALKQNGIPVKSPTTPRRSRHVEDIRSSHFSAVELIVDPIADGFISEKTNSIPLSTNSRVNCSVTDTWIDTVAQTRLGPEGEERQLILQSSVKDDQASYRMYQREFSLSAKYERLLSTKSSFLAVFGDQTTGKGINGSTHGESTRVLPIPSDSGIEIKVVDWYGCVLCGTVECQAESTFSIALSKLGLSPALHATRCWIRCIVPTKKYVPSRTPGNKEIVLLRRQILLQSAESMLQSNISYPFCTLLASTISIQSDCNLSKRVSLQSLTQWRPSHTPQNQERLINRKINANRFVSASQVSFQRDTSLLNDSNSKSMSALLFEIRMAEKMGECLVQHSVFWKS